MANLVAGPDGKPRCGWCGTVDAFFPYHDEEWGFPVDDDQRLFEKLCLEGFQAGLSWRTILNKREHFRQAFHRFDFNKVAKYTQKDVERLLKNEGIVRHRGKIEAVINNAKQAQLVVKEFGSLAAYVWQYEPDKKALPEPQTVSVSDESIAMSKDLKKRGWKFVGPTTVYSFMQAMGMVNDHMKGCVVRKQVAHARKQFNRPAINM